MKSLPDEPVVPSGSGPNFNPHAGAKSIGPPLVRWNMWLLLFGWARLSIDAQIVEGEKRGIEQGENSQGRKEPRWGSVAVEERNHAGYDERYRMRR